MNVYLIGAYIELILGIVIAFGIGYGIGTLIYYALR